MPRIRSRPSIRITPPRYVDATDCTAAPAQRITPNQTPALSAICEISGEELSIEQQRHSHCHIAHIRYLNSHTVCYHTNVFVEKANCKYIKDIDERILESEIGNTDLFYCDNCGKLSEQKTKIHTDEYICNECADEHYFYCGDCEEYYPIVDRNSVEWGGRRVCPNCFDDYSECSGCWNYFHDDSMSRPDEDSNECYCEQCNQPNNEAKTVDTWEYDTDIINWSYSFDPVKWWMYNKWLTKTNLKLGSQEELDRPQLLNEFVEKRYWDYKNEFNKIYKHKDVDKEFKVTLQLQSDTKAHEYIRRIIQISNQGNHLNDVRNKYKNYKLAKLENSKAFYEYVDTFWKNKSKEEPAISFWKYVNKIYWRQPLGWYNTSMFEKKAWFRCIMSTDIDHKLRTLEDWNVFNSCQKPEYCTNQADKYDLAWWAYDLLANGCNIPILIYNKDKLEWRMLCRLFYARNKKEYLLVDRLYATWSLANYKSEIYSQIVGQIISLWYNVIISSYSSHDISVKVYLERNNKVGLKFVKWKEVLRQPLRKMEKEDHFWYYHDSWTRTYYNNKLEVYDAIVGRYFLVTKD